MDLTPKTLQNELPPGSNIDCQNPDLPASVRASLNCDPQTLDDCSSPLYKDSPYCQELQANHVALPPGATNPPGFCQQNPELYAFDEASGFEGDVPGATLGSSSLPDIGDPGFDSSSLGLSDPDNPSSQYTGNGGLLGAGRGGGANVGDGIGGDGGGGLAGGGGAFGPPPGEQEYGAGGDGIYDTDILKGVEGGTATGSQIEAFKATIGRVADRVMEKTGAIDLGSLLKGIREEKKRQKRELAGVSGDPTITPANGPSNFEKVSRVYRRKRALLMSGE